jgi:hypothetical protein
MSAAKGRVGCPPKRLEDDGLDAASRKSQSQRQTDNASASYSDRINSII